MLLIVDSYSCVLITSVVNQHYRLIIIVLTQQSIGAVNNHHLHYAIIISAVCSLFIPTAANGYATNFDYAVQAKWTNNLNFMICLSSIEGNEYEDLFIKAVEEWKAKWNHFAYTLSRASGCHINVHIVKTHSKLTDHGYFVYTYMEYWEHGAITKVDIILPTHAKSTVSKVVKGKAVTTEFVEPLSTTLFYRAALHEFGHALNLGHFDDNGEEPIDIMYAYPASDDQEQSISKRDIEALNWLYLGFFESDITVRTDKKSYDVGDTVKISGRVNPVILDESVRLQVLDLSNKVYASDTVSVSNSGTFTYKLKITSEMDASDSFKVKASYNNMIADASFDVNNPNQVNKELTLMPSAPVNTSKKEEKVTVLDTLIVDNSGSKAASIRSQDQVFISSSLLSSLVEKAEVTYIIQVKSSEGYTVEISSATYNLVSGSSTFAQSWSADSPGMYNIEIFLWKSNPHPEPLISIPIELEVTVA